MEEVTEKGKKLLTGTSLLMEGVDHLTDNANSENRI